MAARMLARAAQFAAEILPAEGSGRTALTLANWKRWSTGSFSTAPVRPSMLLNVRRI